MRPHFVEQLVFSGRCFLLDAKDKQLSVLAKYEHSLSSESYLLNLGALGQCRHFHEGVSHAIRQLFDLDGAHLSFSTNIQISFLIDVRFMVPPKRDVYDVRCLFPLKGFDVLGREIRKVLTRIDLVTFAPHVRVRVNFFSLLPLTLAGIALSQLSSHNWIKQKFSEKRHLERTQYWQSLRFEGSSKSCRLVSFISFKCRLCNEIRSTTSSHKSNCKAAGVGWSPS